MLSYQKQSLSRFRTLNQFDKSPFINPLSIHRPNHFPRGGSWPLFHALIAPKLHSSRGPFVSALLAKLFLDEKREPTFFRRLFTSVRLVSFHCFCLLPKCPLRRPPGFRQCWNHREFEFILQSSSWMGDLILMCIYRFADFLSLPSWCCFFLSPELSMI